jgi:hypothetical protein
MTYATLDESSTSIDARIDARIDASSGGEMIFLPTRTSRAARGVARRTVTVCERCGQACDAGCRAAARRERALVRSLGSWSLR